MAYETITYERKDKVAYIIFNRPKVLNAVNERMILEINDALDEIENDGEIRVLILSGSEKAFISGGDIGMLEAGTREPYKFYLLHDKLMKFLLRLERLSIPVIAAISGYALGGGLEIATACDIRIVTEDGKLGLPEVKLGIMPGAGGTARLPRIVGVGKALEMEMTGEPIDAQEAWRIGLVNTVVPKGKALEAAEEMAEKIIKNAPSAIAQIKNAIQVGTDMNVEGASEYCQKNSLILAVSEDGKEGLKAFLEKRPPVWTGK